MKKICLLLLAMFSFAAITNAQVSVTATAGTTGPTAYTTLKLAFDAINSGVHQGAITIDITASTNEGATPATLNSSGAGSAVYTSVLIRPTADGVSISGAPVTGFGVIQLKGADNVTIDGDNPNTGGTNRNLTVANTAATTVVANSVIRIATAATVVTSADNITIKNCILNGNVTAGNASGITSATGSSGISFGIYCGGNGGATATDAPTALTSATTQTAPSGTTINNFVADNNVVNQCSRAIQFNGAASSVSTGVTISNNNIGTAGSPGTYPFNTPTTTVYTRGIWVAGTNAVTINNNTVQNIISYVGTTIAGIEISAATGTGTIAISNNTVSGVSLNQASSNNYARGISVLQAGGPYSISGNIISNVNNSTASTTITTQPNGIFVATTAASATIEGNKVSTVVDRNAGTFGVSGIFLNGGNNITFRNNFLSDVNQDMTGGAAFSTTFGVSGLRIASGTGHKIYHNTIHLSGALLGTAASSQLTASIAITSTTLTGIDVRNNIFSNTMTGGTTSLAHVAMFLPSAGTSAMNLINNNNAYYSGPTAASQGIAQVGTTAGTGFYLASGFVAGATTPAANFRAYTSTLSAVGTNDNASLAYSTAAPFVSGTDLHIPAATNTPLESGGASIGVTTDIDGDVRPGPAGSVNGGALAADIGADEFDGLFTDISAPVISYTALTTTCTAGDRTLSGVTITDLSGVPTTGSLRPRIYYKKNNGSYFSQPGTLSSGTGTNGTWSFNIIAADMGGLTLGDVVSYYVIAQDVIATPNIASSPAGVVATNVNTITTHPASPNTYVNSGILSGAYTVGAAGNFPTLTAAVAAYNSGCGLGGAVVFNLIDATYPSETYPITINQNAAASSTNTLTIKPASTATLSGSVASNAVIRILGNYVTIDGSNSGGTSRDLTITNTNTTAPSVILIGSTGTTPVTNSGIKNTVIINGANTASAIVIADGPSVGAAGGYFNNITVQNNSIQKAYIGIYTWAIVAAGNGNVLITQNDLNTSGANSNRLVGIYLQGVDGAVASNNNVGNMANTLDASNLTGMWLATGTVNTTISGNNISNISGSSTAARGIAISSGVAATNINITGNTISGISSATASATSGIMLFSTTQGVTIQKNVIRNIKNSTAVGTYGLNLATTSTGANINVMNNLISDVASLGSTTSTSNGNGIVVSAGSGYNIYYNTVNLNSEQTAATGIPAAINITSGVTAAGAINLRNNIFTTSQTVGANRYAIYSGAANTVFAAIDYNDYYTTGPNLGFIGSNRVDLAAIQTGFGGNTNSKNILPVYMSATDMHLNPGYNPTLNNLGTNIAGITTDIDGDTRNATTPDMGADEYNACTPPTTATASSNSPVCSGTTLNLIGTTDGTSYSWTGPNGFTSNALSPSITNVPLAAAGVYTFQSFLAGCPSLAATTTVVVNPSPTVTSVGASSTTICVGSSINLTSNAVSNLPPTPIITESFEGGAVPAGWVSIKGATGNLWTIGPVNGTPRTGTRNMEYNWNSTEAATAYLITSGVALTGGVTYTISSWYKGTGTTFPEKMKVTVGTAQTIAAQTTVIQDLGSITTATYTQQSATFTPATSGTYYFGWNCYSDANMFHLDLDDISIGAPADPTYSWTSSPAGFTSSLQNPTGVTPTVTTTYTVTATNPSNGCSSSGNVTVTVNTPPSATINYAGSPYCSNAGTANVTQTGTTGGTYSSTAGLSINSTTGAINLGASTPGTYTVTYAFAATACPAASFTTSVTITAAPSATIAYTGNPYCNVGTAAPTQTGTAGGTYSASPAGVTINPSTGQINLLASTPGSYTITYTIAAAGGCALYTTTAPLTINSCTPPVVTVTATAGNTGPVGYTTLKAAFDAINDGTHQGAITVNINGNTNEGATAAVLNGSGGTSSYTSVLVRPTADNLSVSAGTMLASHCVIELNGADNVTIDGDNPNSVGTNRNLTITAIGTTATTGLIWIKSVSAADGATNNTIKNCILLGQNSTNTTIGILAGSGSTFGGAAAAANSNTTIDNNQFSRSQNGIYWNGFATAPNYDANLAITNNTFGSTVAADKHIFRGMILQNVSNFTISGNTIQGVVSLTTSGANMSGIQLAGAGNGGNIFNNKISDIKQTNTTGFGAEGITLGFTTTTSNVNVYNNFISDVAGQGWLGTSTPTNGFSVSDNGNGIAIVAGGGYNVYYNTVHMNTNQTNNGNPAALLINTVTPANTLNIRNNIFTNSQTVGTNRFSVISVPAAGVYADINYNDYFTTGPNLGNFAGTNQATIAAWRTATTKDVNSVNVAPAFVSATDLHLAATGNCALDGTGTPIGTVPNDIDNAVRSATTPDIGADEFASAPRTATIAYNSAPYCVSGGTATVTQTGTTGGTYTAPAGVTINASTGAITLGTSTPGTYTITYTVAALGACPVVVATTSITINAAPSATISYAGSPYCQNAGTANVTQTGSTGGTYSSTAGLTINATTGAVTLGTSTPGTYTVTYTIPAANGCAVFTTTASITITATPNATISYTGSPYCQNAGTATVTQTGSTGGTYSSTAGLVINATTGAVTLGTSTPGTYTVTYTVAAAGGCAAFSTTASITITATPNATISYTGSPYCQNAGTANVTRTGTAGGTYSSTAGLTINASTGAVTLGTSTPGTYTVTYTVAASGGCAVFTTTTSITITVPPSATINYAGSPYCGTGTATVTRTGTAGGTYSSTAGLSINATTGDVNLGASTPGTYTVTYTVAAAGGCAVFTTTASITINTTSTAPTGATTSVTTNCGPANGVVLSVTGGSLGTGASWKWYTGSCGGTLVGTGASITLNVAATTTYYVRAEGTCNTTTCATVTVTINPQPTISLIASPYTSLMPGWTTTLTATINPVVAGNTIVWYRNGSVVSGATGNTLNVTVDELGSYTARVTSPFGCTALSSALLIKDSATNKLFISPNPNSGRFKIRYYTSATNFGFLRTVLIYDSKGAIVYNKRLPITAPYSSMDIDMTNAAKGIYMVVVADYQGKPLAQGKVDIQ